MAILRRCGFDRFIGLKRSLFFAVVIMAMSSLLYAQQPSPTVEPTPDDPGAPVRIKTDLVTLTLTVTDLFGRYVSGLGKNAFMVMDDKKPQEITYFSDDDSPGEAFKDAYVQEAIVAKVAQQLHGIRAFHIQVGHVKRLAT